MPDYRMIRMPQRRYSPDRGSSDFYVFGIVKNRLEQIQICDADDYFHQLDGFLSSILAGKFKRVFAAWLDRGRQVSESDGQPSGRINQLIPG
jgi:hypothetical protein